jgi:ATP-dependent RNA helicase DeaD
MLKAIDKLGFEQAAPIQAEAIPLLMQGRDVAGQSQTGSGKTAAFAIPAVEKIDVALRAVQVLVLCPTRELAVQVSEEIHKLAFFKRGLHALPVYGGQSYDRQISGLRQGAHIVIGTPGRVMDHMRRNTLKLDQLKMVILDEVDVMLNMGFRDDIELILQATPKERQTVVFSATIPAPIRHLIEKYSRDPQQVRIEQKALTVPTVEQVYYEIDRYYKLDLLTRLIDIHDFKLGIIFCNTKRMVDELVDHLNVQGYSADRLHGDMNQAQRDRVMNKFRKSGLEFLVATDVAARGIDVDDVEVVFNYDLPYDGEDYVHRIGRTGRKGRSGRAISFACGREVFQIRNIERYTNMRIQRGKVPTANEVEQARAAVFLDKLRITLKTGEYKRFDHLVELLLEEGFASTDIASALIHQLQSGGSTPAKGAKAEEYEAPERPERPSDRARPDDRYARGPDRRNERPRPPARPADRPRPMARTVVAAAPATPTPPAPAAAPALQPVAPPPAEAVRTPTANVAVAAPAQPEASPYRAQTEQPAATPTPSPAPAPVSAPRPVAPAPVAEAARPAVKAPPATVADFARTESDEARPPTFQSMGKSHPVHGNRALAKMAAQAARAREASDSCIPGKPRASRTTPTGQTRLWMSLGEEMGILPIDIVNTIAGETGLPGKVVGTVDIRERHLFVDVASEHVNGIIAKLKRTQIKGHKVKVKVA